MKLFLDEQLADRRLQDVVIARLGLIDLVIGMVVAVMVVAMVMIVICLRHRHILSSQLSNTSMRKPSFGDPE